MEEEDLDLCSESQKTTSTTEYRDHLYETWTQEPSIDVMAMAVLAFQQKMAAIKIQRAYRSMVSRRERIKKRKEQIEQLRPWELQIGKPPKRPQNEISKSVTESKTPKKRKSVEKLFEFKTKNGHKVHANIIDFENGDHKLCLVSAVKPKNRQIVGLKQKIENAEDFIKLILPRFLSIVEVVDGKVVIDRKE
jgi:hypothetical protein